MKLDFLEGGQIVNTHGIKGEVKIVSWCDTPEFLAAIPVYYIDGAPVKVRAAQVHKGNVLASLEGYDDVNTAMTLKNKTVYFHRSDANLPQGSFFLADIIGLDVVDEAGQKLGVLKDILSPSRQQVYVVSGQRELMIPAVPEFILETNIEGGYIKVRLIEGM